MKKVWSLVLFLSVLLMPISSVFAAEGYFKAGDTVSDSESYHHANFLAGNNVISNSNVDGLSFTAGNSIRLSGSKTYAFVAGNVVEISSAIERDLFAAGSVVKINKDAYIGGDVYAAAGNVVISNNIEGNIFVAGNQVELNGVTINGDIHVATENLVIIDDVTINGNLIINDNAIILSEDHLKVDKKYLYEGETSVNFDSFVKNEILEMLSMIFLGIILAMVFTKLFKKFEVKLEGKDILRKSLSGLIILILVPIVGVLSITLIVGIPLAVILFAVYIITLLIANIIASTTIGYNINKKLIKQEKNIYISVIVGILVLKVFGIIPIIGPLATLIAFLYGIGSLYQLFKERNK